MVLTEVDRIRAEYARRDRQVPADRYAITQVYNLFVSQQKNRLLLKLLTDEHLTPLKGRAILDVGCGEGHHLLEFVIWGANRADLAGIDLLDNRVERAMARIGSGDHAAPDLRVGDASRLPWADATFDVVHQGTVFTSICDGAMKAAVAHEMLRVLKPGGAIAWYDLRVDNPHNPHVRGIGAAEVRALFPGCTVRLHRVTLAPPIGRRLVPISWIGSLLLEKVRLLNSHYLGIIRKDPRQESRRRSVGAAGPPRS